MGRPPTSRRQCLECNIFHETCNGEQFERERGSKVCINRVQSHETPMNRVQIAAFLSLYHAKVSRGMKSVDAFVEAICQTSDDAWREAVKKRPEKIKRYLLTKPKMTHDERQTKIFDDEE